MPNELELYVRHPGTIIIAGKTQPHAAASCALHFLEQGQVPVEFLCIGGNANQQAIKAMHSFRCSVTRKLPGHDVSFVPLMFSTETVSPVDQSRSIKTCTVWRTIIRELCLPRPSTT